MTKEATFTGQQAATAQTALREALSLPPEQFSAQAFVGMISDEIEQLRASGLDEIAIAALITKATGQAIDPDTITKYYASPEARGHHGREG